MGAAKRMIEERDARWDGLARSRGWLCDLCGVPIPFEERELYFETDMCAHCAYMISKDD